MSWDSVTAISVVISVISLWIGHFCAARRSSSLSDESGTDEIASVIGKAIGKSDLKWVKFPAADFKQVLRSFGFAEGATNEYVEMFTTLGTGLLFEDYVKVKPKLYPTKIEDFAKKFAAAYRA
jgi:hypothetical protein